MQYVSRLTTIYIESDDLVAAHLGSHLERGRTIPDGLDRQELSFALTVFLPIAATILS
jgi:hypothetical protein